MSPNPHDKPKAIGCPNIIPPESLVVDTEDITVPRIPRKEDDSRSNPSNGCYRIKVPTCCTNFYIRGTDPKRPEQYSEPFRSPLEMNFPLLREEFKARKSESMEELTADGIPVSEEYERPKPSNVGLYSGPLISPYKYNHKYKFPGEDFFIENHQTPAEKRLEQKIVIERSDDDDHLE